MTYNEYKIENLTFLKGTKDWTIEEKREFLETCPENKGLDKTLEDLKELKKALEEGLVKQREYHAINKNSLKAYLAKRDANIKYGRPWHSYLFSDDKDFYIHLDGSYKCITHTYDVESLIKYIESDENTNSRFETLASTYSKKENDWSKGIEENRYRATHAEQIAANKKLDSIMSGLIVTAAVGFENGHFGRQECKFLTMRPTSDYWYHHSNYGEILVNNAPLTEAQATELTDMLMEMSKKVADIINEYKPVIDKAMGKKGA